MCLHSGCDEGKPPTFFERHSMFWPYFWIILCFLILITGVAIIPILKAV